MFAEVIREAKERIIKDPFDAGHDWNHHLDVVVNCLLIIGEENLEVDMNALLIAACWHDYKRNDIQGNDRVLSGVLEKAGYDENFINKVLKIKNSHSYGEDQDGVEAAVLFDADKLEYLSPDRYNRVTEATKKGNMSMETLQKYKKVFKARIGNIKDQLHFETSKRIFDERMEKVRAYVKANPDWSDLLEMV